MTHLSCQISCLDKFSCSFSDVSDCTVTFFCTYVQKRNHKDTNCLNESLHFLRHWNLENSKVKVLNDLINFVSSYETSRSIENALVHPVTEISQTLIANHSEEREQYTSKTDKVYYY